MKFSIVIKNKDNSISYLSHKGRDQWSIRTAKKHLKDVTAELIAGNSKWNNVRYFAIVEA
jgi:hypothetical protein